MSSQQTTVFVGVSGGVDSSVTLALLQQQGYKVVGVFIRTWQPDWIECTWRDERRDAMRVCAHLRVPFVELDLEKEYKEGVADYMIREYQRGRTPNPDVMCNREVKFGGFLKWARRHGADYIATGHYVARTEEQENINLLRGIDTNKDQSYFLWTLTQEELRHCLFPLGNYTKSQVRALAKKFKLPTAVKKDSQGICFIGEIDMKEFLSHYITPVSGVVLDTQGVAIGTHNGALFYTLGERHGFLINPKNKKTNDTPYYVVAKDIIANTLTVSHDSLDAVSAQTTFTLEDVVDNQGILHKGMNCEAQIRYRSQAFPVTIIDYDINNNTITVQFTSELLVAHGQSIVFYKGNQCLGGGIIA